MRHLPHRSDYHPPRNYKIARLVDHIAGVLIWLAVFGVIYFVSGWLTTR